MIDAEHEARQASNLKPGDLVRVLQVVLCLDINHLLKVIAISDLVNAEVDGQDVVDVSAWVGGMLDSKVSSGFACD